MFKSLLLGLLMLPALLAAAQTPPANAVFIDVRTPQEFAEGHVEGAVRIPYDGIAVGVQALGLDKDRPLYLYCGRGARAGVAAERLQQMGFSAVTNAGGVDQARELRAQQLQQAQ